MRKRSNPTSQNLSKGPCLSAVGLDSAICLGGNSRYTMVVQSTESAPRSTPLASSGVMLLKEAVSAS